MDRLCQIRVFSYFWNFPEIAWRVMNHRQAAHLFVLISGFLKWNRLVARIWPPSDTWLQPKFWVFWLNCLVVTNYRQATRASFSRIWCFRGSG